MLWLQRKASQGPKGQLQCSSFVSCPQDSADASQYHCNGICTPRTVALGQYPKQINCSNVAGVNQVAKDRDCLYWPQWWKSHHCMLECIIETKQEWIGLSLFDYFEHKTGNVSPLSLGCLQTVYSTLSTIPSFPGGTKIPWMRLEMCGGQNCDLNR